LIELLSENPQQGQPLGNNCYKIRLAIKSKKKGKRSGTRVITYIFIERDTVYLLTIYSKGKQDNISDDEIESLISHIP